jgi:hypothetical protein
MHPGTKVELVQTRLPGPQPVSPSRFLLGCARLTPSLSPAGQVCGAWPLQLFLLGGG